MAAADASGSAADYKLHFNQSADIYHGGSAGPPRSARRLPGYAGHIPSHREALGASVFAAAAKATTTAPTETEHQRLRTTSEQAWLLSA